MCFLLLTKTKIIAVLEKKVRIFDYAGNLTDENITHYNDAGFGIINTDENKELTIAMLGPKKGTIGIWKPAIND